MTISRAAASAILFDYRVSFKVQFKFRPANINMQIVVLAAYMCIRHKRTRYIYYGAYSTTSEGKRICFFCFSFAARFTAIRFIYGEQVLLFD